MSILNQAFPRGNIFILNQSYKDDLYNIVGSIQYLCYIPNIHGYPRVLPMVIWVFVECTVILLHSYRVVCHLAEIIITILTISNHWIMNNYGFGKIWKEKLYGTLRRVQPEEEEEEEEKQRHTCLVVIHYIIHVYVISNVRLLHWNLKRIFRWDAVCCFMAENIE